MSQRRARSRQGNRVGSLASLRELNRRQVLRTLGEAGPVSRAEVARRTGLSRSTVSSLVAELQTAGLVVEAEGAQREAPSDQGGRPGVLIALDRSAGVAAGIDFGHRHLRVAVADLGHTVLAEAVTDREPDARAEADLDTAVRLFDRVLAEAGADRDQVLGIGMGLPAPIDSASGTVGATALLPGWVAVRAGEELGHRIGLPVLVDNDANLGALAEWTWGAGRDCTELAYIKVSSGIGAGLVLGGRLFRGASGTAGEIGHITVDESGPVCRCGNRGCLEVVAGAPAILELLRPVRGPGLTLRDVLEMSAAGDQGTRRVLADAGRQIGIALANLCNLFNPERVVVGGQLGQAGDVLLDPMREAVGRGAISTAAEAATIVAGRLGERAELLGALALVLREPDRFLPIDHDDAVPPAPLRKVGT
jgi:predicted NBD/HSP70 family sugar kinase